MGSPPEIEQCDVLICGGGPVGLLTAYCLARYGISICIIEQNEREKQVMYGRAAMIAPRCLEMLEQLDLADALMQIGFAVRGQVHYKDGQRFETTKYASSNITDTFYDFLLLVRQKYTEEVFHEGYRKYSGTSVGYGVKLRRFVVHVAATDYLVESMLETNDGENLVIRSKYLIGADGGRSTVREMAGINFEREKTSRYFIRIDGIVTTNMPEARKGLCGVESSSHGSVLWACLDHGRTRVGFAFPEDLWKAKGAKLTQEDVICEAKKALQPFTLEFETVDWWTAYSVGQGLATDYWAQERVFIAGDAAHTHSSAAAQGMNTGLHDAVNLSWKLAGYIKGWYTDAVLSSYTAERRYHAAQIVEQDKLASLLTAGEIPNKFKADSNFDIDKTLSEIYQRNQGLNSGIGVQYLADGFTLVDFENTKISAGERAPDVMLQKPCMRMVPVTLYSKAKNIGKFTILIFAGVPEQTLSSLKTLQDYVNGPESWERYSADMFRSLTILQTHNDSGSAEEKLGLPLFGQALYDIDGSAHERYGVDPSRGGVLVLRPDATIGTAYDLDEGAKISEYFARFLAVEKQANKEVAGKDARKPLDQGKGEVDIQAPGLQDWAGLEDAR